MGGFVVSQQYKSRVQMSITTVVVVIFLPLVCIGAAAALMRVFDVKEATLEQAQAEAEKLLAQANREVTIRRRVRAGSASNAKYLEFPCFATLSATRRRFGGNEFDSV